jgi:hypothetical protein
MPFILWLTAAAVFGPAIMQVSDALGRRVAKLIDPGRIPEPANDSEPHGRVDGLSPRAAGPRVMDADDGFTIPPRPARAA